MKRPTHLKLVLLCIFCIFSYRNARAETIYYETFGEQNNIALSASDFNGWSESGCTYEGTAKVGTQAKYDCNLPGSSGKANLYFPSFGLNRFQVSGINTSEHPGAILSFNARVDTGADVMRVYYSIDKGSTWEPVDFPNAPGTAWQTITASTPLPPATDLALKIESTAPSSGLLFIDDLCLTATDSSPAEIPAPEFSRPPGTYYEPFTLEISCSAPYSTIYYTLDGSLPNLSSSRYASPLLISTDVTLCAVAYVGTWAGEPATAVYRVENLPEYTGVEALKTVTTPERCKLLPDGATVTATDNAGFFLQDGSGGMHVLCEVCPYAPGDKLTGYLIGTCVSAEGLYEWQATDLQGATVQEQNTMPEPVTDWGAILQDPERYYGCLVRMMRATRSPEGGLRSLTDGSEVSVYDHFAVLPDDYKWPATVRVSGLLLPYESMPALAVRSLQDILPFTAELLPPIGTILLCEDDNGLHAASHTLSNQGLLSERVYRNGECVVLARSQYADGRLFWETDAQAGLLRIPGGDYLAAKTYSELEWCAKAADAKKYPWRRSDEGGWLMTRDSKERALLYSDSYFKLYAQSSIGAPGFARQAATDVPAYMGCVRTVTPGRFGTLCLPYDVSAEALDGVELYAIQGKLVDASGQATDIVLQGPLTALAAGVPYLFRTTADRLVLPYAGTEVPLPATHNGLTGTLEGINTAGDPSDESLTGRFVLSENRFRLCAAGSSLAAERAYLDLEAVPVVSADVKGLRLTLREEATPIRSLSASETPQPAAVYTLQGTRVGSGPDFGSASRNLPPGVYLYRGHKHLIP